MPYFTAGLIRDGKTWAACDVDVDSYADLHDLTAGLRTYAVDDETVVLLIEHEDEWFALVRVDADEDPRVFVSDGAAAAASPYAAVLGYEDEELAEGPIGEADVLDDAGFSSDALLELCGDDGVPTGDAVAVMAEAAGFADVVDAMR